MKKYNYKTLPDLLLDKEWQIKTNTIETNFKNVRDQICNTFESLEKQFSLQKKAPRESRASPLGRRATKYSDLALLRSNCCIGKHLKFSSAKFSSSSNDLHAGL